ncbi:YjbQ family protein [candidate division KSB1 bacterium]|nr:YjbQ family protein [candidate division KSB1 bacterium]
MMKFKVDTRSTVELVKITSQVQNAVSDSGMKDGICVVFCPHTTAAITINEGADPSVVDDMRMELNKIIPFEDGYHHLEGNSAAHIKTTLVGPSEMIIVEDGRLQLGTWQSIFFCEFDGPRHRSVWVKLMPDE